MTKVKGRDIDDKVVVLKRSQPQQLSLFQYFPEENEACANTIDLYDVMPKHFPSHHKLDAMRRDGKYLDILIRNFVHGGQEYRLEIAPAALLTKTDETKHFYPTEREILVEEALRKIACDRSNGVYLDDAAGVQFTLNQLREELARMGHSIRYDSLIEALKVCNKVNVTVRNKDGSAVVSAPIFPVLIVRNRKEWSEDSKDALYYVKFNPLVTAGINKLEYRQHNYQKFMTYKQQLSRWLHKRLYNAFIYAGVTETYHIKATTIIRDSGLVNNKELRYAIRAIDESLEELKQQRILTKFFKERSVEGKKIIDIKYTLYPCWDFISEMKIANKRHKHIGEHKTLFALPTTTKTTQT